MDDAELYRRYDDAPLNLKSDLTDGQFRTFHGIGVRPDELDEPARSSYRTWLAANGLVLQGDVASSAAQSVIAATGDSSGSPNDEDDARMLDLVENCSYTESGSGWQDLPEEDD